MTNERALLEIVLALALGAWVGGQRCRAQAPTLPEFLLRQPGSVRSSLGPIPGAGGNPFGMSPGTDPQFLGGRPGPSFPRVPSAITTPGGPGVARPQGVAAPPRLSITNVPVYGPLEVPALAEPEGPPDGLTLDAAVERLVRDNLFLAAQRWQVPAARADVLTARLRANPILFADGQLVPYSSDFGDRNGGPTQFDLNVTHPVDYSGKRRARTAAAEAAVNVQEALYQEAVRVQIDNLYTAFVDVLAARETVRYARASQGGLKRLVEINEVLYREANVTRPDVNRAREMLNAAGVAAHDAEATLRKTSRTLGALLNLPPEASEAIPLRGTIADLAPPPPARDELIRIALASRPDLAAERLGGRLAAAELRLARANRFGDAYVLYQPYTFQDLAPSGKKSATSWALGVTVPIPIYNRNQGGVLRYRLNVAQTAAEVAEAELRVVAEVHDARRRYEVTRAMVAKIERDLLPAATHYREDTLRLFAAGAGGVTAVEAAAAQKDYNQVVRQYRDALISHRRSMLALNTAVGSRVLP